MGEQGQGAPRDGAVLLLGMHRSGTSALAGSFREAGLYMGSLLDDGFTHNPSGLQEPAALIHMHEHLLNENGGAWHDPPATLDWDHLHEAVRDLFIESRRGKGLWGFKEPRTLLVVDGWIKALDHWTAVGIFRDPRSVAASIKNRNGFDLPYALRIWEAYNARLLKLHTDYGIPIVEYNQDEDYVRSAINDAIRTTGLTPPAHLATLNMQHFRQSAETGGIGLPDHIERLNKTLQEIAGTQKAAGFGERKRFLLPTFMRKKENGEGELMSTRLFPKTEGALAYRVTGIAARCDWVYLTDTTRPNAALIRQTAGHPRTVFLSLRNMVDSLWQFRSEVLPLLTQPVILISGSEDITLPKQTDKRWPPFTASDSAVLRDIANSPHVEKWYAENLEEPFSDKVAPLPLGMVFPDAQADRAVAIPDTPPLRDRPLKVLCAHRVRDDDGSDQWHVRRNVTELSKTAWQPFCTVVEGEVSRDEFHALTRTHAFIICAEGGGIDPSPKAWEALLQGAIPIIRSHGVRSAYRQLPVAQVSDWTADEITVDRLVKWREQLAPQINDESSREALRHKLSLDYWWHQITATRL